MKRILLTGFEPFSDIKTNPSETLVTDLGLALKRQSEHDVETLILPVDYKKTEHVLKTIDVSKYDFIFQFGVAAKRSRISLERVALNWIESQIPDNSGNHINCHQIDSNQVAAKFNSLDLVKIANVLNSEFPETVEVSLSAGAYLCNFVYFKTLAQKTDCLFVHIPCELNYQNQEWHHSDTNYRQLVCDIVLKLIQIVI